MHILIDYRSALRERTGVGEYVHQLTAALLRQLGSTDKITLFSSSWKDRFRPDTLYPAAVLDLRVPVKLLNFAWHRLEWPPVEVFGGRADVAWSLHPLLMPSRRAAQVVTIHDLFFLDRPEATAGEIRRDYPALAAVHARRADGVIVNSLYTRRSAVERLGLDESKTTVCYPGAPDWAARTGIAPGRTILHVGTIEPRKNVSALIEAFALLARTRSDVPTLVFAGRVAQAPETAIELMRQGRVSFLGYVSDERKRQLYREAAMVVIPSHDEGFGMPAVEAMAMGVPLIAADRGSLPEVAGDAALLVDPDRPEALAAAMARVLDDGPLRQTLARRGVERAKTFDWEVSAARLLAAFESALRRRMAR